MVEDYHVFAIAAQDGDLIIPRQNRLLEDFLNRSKSKSRSSLSRSFPGLLLYHNVSPTSSIGSPPRPTTKTPVTTVPTLAEVKPLFWGEFRSTVYDNAHGDAVYGSLGLR